ncbi:GNAT family N-acetyltransferase [Terribacillus saccharophilus]|uniref:GNAT family N-acetyltransferase n=1 Tax=Terribacillus saccharophilus TaxID=361277 RepID=UPI00398287F6
MITFATPEDASVIHLVMLAAFEEYRHMAIPSSALNERADSIRTSLNVNEKAFLYWRGETAVGTVRFKEQNDALYFFRLSVLPEERGRGIAGQLLQALEDYAAAYDFAVLRCQVRLTEERNINLYKKNGFHITDSETVVKPNGNQVETVTMTKNL